MGTFMGEKAAGRVFETATVDSDMRNEAAWLARPELERQWKEENARELAEVQAKARADKAGVKKASVTTLDTDHTDEEAWIARKNLEKRSKARMKAEAKQLALANKKFFAGVNGTLSNVDRSKMAQEECDIHADQMGLIRKNDMDIDITDEGEWKVRGTLAAQSAEIATRDQDDLKQKNRSIASRLASVRPKVVVTSKFGKEEWSKPEYVDAYEYDPNTASATAQSWMPRNREKYVPRLNWSVISPTNLDKRPPLWLKQWEHYDWGEHDKLPSGGVRVTAGYTFGVVADEKNHERRLAKERHLIETGQVRAARHPHICPPPSRPA